VPDRIAELESFVNMLDVACDCLRHGQVAMTLYERNEWVRAAIVHANGAVRAMDEFLKDAP
jgi:hypothetical protein